MEKTNPETLRRQLAHVYWLGGSPCAGKSSIADSLVQTYRFQIYRCDDAFFRHEKIVTPEQQPVFYRLVHLSSEALWMQRPIEQQVVEEIAFYREEFSLILDELLCLPRSKPILVEGAALLPECVKPLLHNSRHALWIVPTREFQLHYYSNRVWAKDVVKECSDPEQAFKNWMERDIGFASFVTQETVKLALDVLVVDGQHTLAENIEVVRQHFLL
jgi:adenylate kinase family enzyme